MLISMEGECLCGVGKCYSTYGIRNIKSHILSRKKYNFKVGVTWGEKKFKKMRVELLFIYALE